MLWPREVKMMPVREKEVEGYLCSRLEEIGLPVYKFVPDQAAGMPDRLVLLPDERCLWIETKKPKGGRVATLQKFRHHELRKAGHDVRVCWTKEEADEIVEWLRCRLRL
jgi:hypothetical protein